MSRPAAFLDRDGTINVDTNYVGRAEDVALIPGAAEAIRRLNAAGVPVVVVTNQSGIARRMFDLVGYEGVRARIDALLGEAGARVDATYMCPHAPELDGPCECRKPGTLLHRQAAAALDLDLARSWYVGDKWRDVAPGLALGGTGVLVPDAGTPPEDLERARREALVLPSLGRAVDAMLDALHPASRAG
ncbi:MAG TPA: HAD-IIIA family hydrolase [Gemmatimonadaceae bacterium]|nr:HAD-IIIA family hydrolase [Gemmatimonadaceae bacterium]